jgi:hypothetical protein
MFCLNDHTGVTKLTTLTLLPLLFHAGCEVFSFILRSNFRQTIRLHL